MDKEKIQQACQYNQVQNKYALCQTLVNYIKKLGYYQDITFNILFNPTVGHIRKVFSFLFEQVAKLDEIGGQKGKGEEGVQTEANLDFVVKRRITKWKKKAWMIPEFQVLPKPNILA